MIQSKELAPVAPASPTSLNKSDTSAVPLDFKGTIEALRLRCPLPVLMRQMGLGKYVRPSCCSPLRPDNSPSWGIFQRADRWYWKDLGTDESGDELDFIIQAKNRDLRKSRLKALAYWKEMADGATDTPVLMASPKSQLRPKPDATGFGSGDEDQIHRLASLRGIELSGLRVAQERGLLVFGRFAGHEVFGITDASGNVLEVRRLDGQMFPAHGELHERKSHALRGSQKNWPVGLANVGDRPMILMVEGLPDLLAAFEVLVREDALARVAPVAMLSASSRISKDSLPLFQGRHVRVVNHVDEPGRKAAREWKGQLLVAGATKVDFVDLNTPQHLQSGIKDLNEFLPIYRQELVDSPIEGRMLS